MNLGASVIGVLASASLLALVACNPGAGQTAAGPGLTSLSPSSSFQASANWIAAGSAAQFLSQVSRRPVDVIRAKGASMKPASADAVWLIVERCPFSELTPGDWVIFNDDAGQSIGHRAIERAANGAWWVKGDNNAAADRIALREANFRGRVVAVFYELREGQP